MSQKTALVLGATGLIGDKLLDLLLADQRYTSISTLGRRAPDQHDARLRHNVADMSDLDSVPATDSVFCCLGSTIKKAGSRSAFKAIDLELVRHVASLTAAAGATTFIAVSSVGAEATSGNFYLRVKGEMENAITAIDFAKTGFIRPSLLLGSREEFRAAEKLGAIAARMINPFLAGPLGKYRAVEAKTVAAAMIGLDQSDYSGKRMIEGDQITDLAARKNA